METKTTIKELTHEDLVNLLCTATYGSSWLDCYLTDIEGVDFGDDDCREDMWAHALLAGKRIMCVDYYAEEESYGTLDHETDEDGNVCYFVTLEDIKDGLQKCADGTAFKYGNFLKRCYDDLANESYNFDQVEADALMQVIVLGELIYG